MIFLVSCWLANLKGADQMAYKFNGKWFFYKKTKYSKHGSLEVYHLQIISTK